MPSLKRAKLMNLKGKTSNSRGTEQASGCPAWMGSCLTTPGAGADKGTRDSRAGGQGKPAGWPAEPPPIKGLNSCTNEYKS